MGFKRMTAQDYPPRLWSLVGFPGSGKSTFSTRMRGPLLTIDADQRYREVLNLAAGDVFELSDKPADNVDPDTIARLLDTNMPGADVGTIVVDSLTTIIAPLVTRAVIANQEGRNKNRMSAFVDKALAMRLLQDSLGKWGCDVLWIYHLQEGRNAQAENVTTPTVSRTELARLARSLNLQLEMVQDAGRRGIKVVWARQGRCFPEVPILWDEVGLWRGMPERIEAEVYDGLSQVDQVRIAGNAPAVFPSAEVAIAWGLEQGAFQALQHARNAYDKLKDEMRPGSAQEMREIWVADVTQRLLEAQGETNG